MRGWLVLIAVLASLPTPNQSAGTDANHRDAVRHMENSLLSMFGMTRRPRVDRSKVVIPQAMRDMYNTITGLDLGALALPKAGIHTKTANTVRSFTHSESDIDKRFPGRHRFRLSFNVSSIPKGEILKAAELTLNRKKLEDHEGPRHQQVLVYDLVRPGVKGKRDPILVLVDSKKVDVRKSGSVSLDVLPAVERWLANPKNNHGLVVHIAGPRQHQALGHHIRLRRSVDEDRARWQPKQPLLFTYTDDGKAKHRTGDAMMQNRARRASAKRMHRRKDGSENCKRRSLYVDFADVGWNDWIVAPPGYDAYYCHGDCPFPMADHLNSTNHAIVQTLVNSVNPAAVPKACCVPTQLSPISMLYLDEENKVVLKNYQDMAVLGCGCR